MKRSTLVLLMLVTVGAMVVLFVRPQLSLVDLAAREQELRRTIAAHPWQSFLIATVLYYLISLVPGTSGKSVVLGWLFGFFQGVLLVDLSLTAAAMTIFGLSRWLFRDAIEHRFAALCATLNHAVAREGTFYLLTLRMFHVPFSLVNLVSAASRVSLASFSWTTAVGLLPGTIVFVLLGSRLPTLQTLVDQGTLRLLDPWLLAALLLTGLLPLGTRWLARRIRGSIPGPAAGSRADDAGDRQRNRI